MIVHKPSAEELRALDQPPAAVVAKIDRFLPPALNWYNQIEAQLLPQGRPLSAAEVDSARQLGVAHPEKVRVVVLDTFPMPEDPELRANAERYGMGNHSENGRAIGYAIMLKPQYKDEPTLLRHELVHVGQHDRLGRTAFIRRYLVEMEMMGYARSPLELEAYEKQ
ncbi:MAG: hypothetical protein HY308_01350 [Gammaproteobacteria bacterium]|nr:hypothetical protein [Gammaproteobacteria bacterium]